ncbi:MAG TPA: IclR family transcriptional regulator [Trebonia sp.]
MSRCLKNTIDGSSAINALEKDLAVLEALSYADSPHRLAEIVARVGIGKPSVHRILQEMVRSGFATGLPGGYYAPGPRLVAVASMVVAEEQRIRDIPAILESVRDATGYTVHFAVRSGDEAVYVHKVNSDRPYQMRSRVGMRIPLYCTSIGKCILAWLDQAVAEEILDRSRLEPRTPHTLTTREQLTDELARIREQGFAIDNQENEANVRCAGVPVFDAAGAVIGGMSISTLVFELSLDEATALAPRLASAAGQLSAAYSVTGAAQPRFAPAPASVMK